LLWIRVDPELELIRNIRVEQDEDNWHYQLLKEKDIIGQYEAIHALKKYNTESAYEALKHVIQNNEYFYKIREEALDAIVQMNTKEFNKYLSSEKFLIKAFNEFDHKGKHIYLNYRFP
jgi:transcription initiation factor TFIID subunit 2